MISLGVCFYHSTGSKDHESLLVPTLGALRYMLRSEYVLKTTFGCINNERINPSEYGWRVNEPMISIVWYDEETIKAVVASASSSSSSSASSASASSSSASASKGCGCKGAKCDGSTAGCRNCYRMCKACNSRCKCKGNCSNPHNNGGTCARCEPHDESDDNATDDEEQAPETLPLVSRDADNIDSGTDSDDGDHDDADDDT